MPNNLKTFSTCAGPGIARPHNNIGGFTGIFISAYYANGTLTIVGGVAYALWLIFAAPPLAWCATAAAIIIAASEFKFWYYNERLLCIRDRDCAIGTVISEPTVAEDGDRKLNLLLAPFSQFEIEYEDETEPENSLVAQIDRNRGWLESESGVTVPSLNTLISNRTLFKNFMSDLKGANENLYNQLTIGVVDTILQDPDKAFYRRYWRRDSGEITDAATLAEIPIDFDPDPAIDWQGSDARSNQTFTNPFSGDEEELNPMFRFADNPMVPYLHCEIEGNSIEILMDDIIVAASGFVIGCAFLGPLGGAVLGFLLWLFKKLFDWISGNDGEADYPDVDWDDPDFTGFGDVTETTGDVVVVWGNWIMDAEHKQYFEIHPVRAYYIVATRLSLPNDERNFTQVIDDVVLTDRNVVENFDPTRVDATLARRICDLIRNAEETTPPVERTVRVAVALSHGLKGTY